MILYYLIASYLLAYSLYWLGTVLAGLAFHSEKPASQIKERLSLLVLVPAYNPDERLLDALKALQESIKVCPTQVYVLLQHCRPEIAIKAKAFPFVVEIKDFSQGTGNVYHEVLRYMLKNAPLEASHTVLLDKDNLVKYDFFLQLSPWLHGGYDVVQGRRLPIALGNTTELYDGLSESLNDLMLRAGKAFLGLAPELSGSAVAFKSSVFAQAVERLDGRAPGMDKNLMVQLLLLPVPVKMAYQPEAVVWEEKTGSEAVRKLQRTRWFGNQYFNALYYSWPLVKSMRMSAIDYAITLCRPPRSIQLLLVALLALLEIGAALWGHALPWLGVTAAISIAASLSLFLWNEQRGSLLALALRFPHLALQNMASALAGIAKKQRGRFIHTTRN